MSERRLRWSAPILRPHAGALLGNATQGLMVWGAGDTLRISIGRSGFWDHRWGNNFSSGITYQEVRRLLEAGDEEGLRRAFSTGEGGATISANQRPHQLGAGRLDLRLPEGWRLVDLELGLETAVCSIGLQAPDGGRHEAQLRQASHLELAWIDLPPGLPVELELVPVHEQLADELEALGVAPPERWQQEGITGYTQHLPEDEPLSVGVRRELDSVMLATALGSDTLRALQGSLGVDRDEIGAMAAAWWADYWRSLPQVHLPDPVLQELCDYGLYKMACCTAPQGVACTLQGPFLEDYQIPPWSCDYHFNINIQMIYWPVLAAGRYEHFAPLWALLKGWEERLREHARIFFGDDEAFMLPHAVDDRCQAVGSFWTGTIDHACTAWMAQMAWLHYRYSGDEQVLREVAWPLLRGAFAGYWAMLERIDDGAGGERFSLPVSVSPEFKGSDIDAWGRDASFQLAAVHMLCQCLPQAAAALGEAPDPRWAEVAAGLPPYTTIEAPVTAEHPQRRVRRIALWEGMDLIDSHRHHSHLGGLYPFASIDPRDPAHAEVVEHSLFHWTRMGPGGWSGWCVPWAAILNARVDRSDAAIAWLHWFHRCFTNEGRGTLHDAAFPGQSTLATRVPWAQRPAAPNREVMQLDGGFGALNAIFELLVQHRHDGIHVLPARCRAWREVSFDGIHCEGGFVVGATVSGGELRSVRVRATRPGTLRLHHGFGEQARVDGEDLADTVLVRELAADEALVIEGTVSA